MEDILQAAVSGRANEIDIWDKIVHYFSENWDGQKDVFQQVVTLSRKQLGDQISIVDTVHYFKILENNFCDKNDLLEFLINLTEHLNYYTECGSVRVSDMLLTCRNHLRRIRTECIKKRLFVDQHFVGRDQLIQHIQKELRDEISKGILLCGLGGMGKTCLANRVCFDLQREDWTTIKVELREQKLFIHFLRTFLCSLGEQGYRVVSSDTDEHTRQKHNLNVTCIEENVMEMKVLDLIEHKRSKKQIYVLDNIDDVTADDTEKNKVLNFIKILLELLETKLSCAAKILITSRENLLLTSDASFRRLINAIEVGSLDDSDAKKLVKECTKQTELTDAEVDSVIHICFSCPLALRIVSSMISYSHGMTEGIITTLERDHLALSAFNINHCLQQPYECLETESRSILCKLSLFGTAKFDLKSAAFVVFGPDSSAIEEQKRQSNLAFIILLFKSRHLIEIDSFNEVFKHPAADAMEAECIHNTQKLYSLHPLVYNFVNEKTKDKKMDEELEHAKCNYIILFHKLVQNIGLEYSTNVLTAREMAEQNNVHITKFLNLIEEFGDLSRSQRFQGIQSFDKAEQICSVISMLFNPDKQLSFIMSMIKNYATNILSTCSWKIEYITALLRYDKDDLETFEVCKETENCLYSLPEKNFNEEEKIQITIFKARLLLYKGRLKMDCSTEESITYLYKAEGLLKPVKSREICNMYLADIYNCLGCVRYLQNEVTKALALHKKAIQQLGGKKCTESALLFNSNIGSCYYRIALNKRTNIGKKRGEFELALRYYNESIVIARVLKLQDSFSYYKQLRNRGNLLCMMQKFVEAKADYKECIKIVKKMFTTISQDEICIRHALGDLTRSQIKVYQKTNSNQINTNSKDIYSDLVVEGLLIYEEIHKLLMDQTDLLPSDHRDFNKIKKNHVYFLEQGGELNKIDETLLHYAKLAASSGTDKSVHATWSPDSNSSSCSSDNDTNADQNEASFQGCINLTDPANNKLSFESQLDAKADVLKIKSSDITLTEKQKVVHNVIETNITNRTSGEKLLNKLPSESNDAICSSGNLLPGLPRKMSIKLCSSSNSGVDNLESTSSLEQRSCSGNVFNSNSINRDSYEDDMFLSQQQNSDNCRGNILKDPAWTGRRSTLKHFGSALSDDICGDDSFPTVNKQKRCIVLENPSLSCGSEVTCDPSVKKARLQESKDHDVWYLKEKLSPAFIQRSKIVNPVIRARHLDNIVDELEEMIPATQSRMRTLIRALDTGNASLVDDAVGRPVVHYTDKEVSK